MENLPQGYRPNVGVCLINSDDQIFVASRLNVPGAWQMPQGGIEEGEEPKSAAIRELREETGIVAAEIIAEVDKWLTYDFPPAVKAKVNRLWGGEWHGQAQKWFLMKLKKDDGEINLATGEADPEFAEWKWASPEEVIEQAVDYKRPTYEEVVTTFKPYFQGNAISAKSRNSTLSRTSVTFGSRSDNSDFKLDILKFITKSKSACFLHCAISIQHTMTARSYGFVTVANPNPFTYRGWI